MTPLIFGNRKCIELLDLFKLVHIVIWSRFVCNDCKTWKILSAFRIFDVLIALIYLHIQVGEDEFGYMLADILKENNVNNKGMRFDPGARTALAFVTLRKDGEREFMFYRNPSADMLLQESELDFELIKKVI